MYRDDFGLLNLVGSGYFQSCQSMSSLPRNPIIYPKKQIATIFLKLTNFYIQSSARHSGDRSAL